MIKLVQDPVAYIVKFCVNAVNCKDAEINDVLSKAKGKLIAKKITLIAECLSATYSRIFLRLLAFDGAIFFY